MSAIFNFIFDVNNGTRGIPDEMPKKVYAPSVGASSPIVRVHVEHKLYVLDLQLSLQMKAMVTLSFVSLSPKGHPVLLTQFSILNVAHNLPLLSWK